MSERVQYSLSFIALLFVSCAGMLHLTWWTVVAGASALTLLPLVERQFVVNRYAVIHRGIPDAILVLSNVLNAAVASAAAFGFGCLSGLVWGI